MNRIHSVLEKLFSSPKQKESSADLKAMQLSDYVRIGSGENIEMLLDKGADVNAKGILGMTALHVAARYAASNVVVLLLTKGGNPTLEDGSGRLPIYHSEARGDTQIGKLLIDARLEQPGNQLLETMHRDEASFIVRYFANEYGSAESFIRSTRDLAFMKEIYARAFDVKIADLLLFVGNEELVDKHRFLREGLEEYWDMSEEDERIKLEITQRYGLSFPEQWDKELADQYARMQMRYSGL